MTRHYVVSRCVRDVVARLSSRIPASRIHPGVPTTTLRPDRSCSRPVTMVCCSGVIKLPCPRPHLTTCPPSQLGIGLSWSVTDDSLTVDRCDRRDLNLVVILSESLAAVEGRIVDVGPTGLMLPPIYVRITHILLRSADRAPGM